MQFRAENSEFHGYSSSSMLQGFLQVTLLRHCSLQKYLMMGIVLMIYNEGNYHFPLKDVMINSSMDTQMVIQSNISNIFFSKYTTHITNERFMLHQLVFNSLVHKNCDYFDFQF